jgi:glycosyltransferase involved in cell wall biosynthesis
MNCGSAKRILHIVEDLKIGGLERVLASIVISLDPSRYDVQVWCLARGGDVAQALIEKGISVRILDMPSYYNPLAVVRLSWLMKSEQFHLIHTHGYFAGTFGRLAAICARIPTVVTHVHSTYYDYAKRNLWIERVLSRFTDRIICVSKAVEKFVTESEGIARDKTCLIYNAVDAPASDLIGQPQGTLRTSFGIGPEAVVITVVASLTENKGHGLLLAAFRQAWRTLPSLRLVIVGDGPLRALLEAEARQLLIDKVVIFAGLRDDVFPFLKMADVCVLPSQQREGLGVALIEAMAVGLPVIGTDLGGIPEVIQNGENGLLVSAGSEEELAAAIRTLADNRDLRSSMGRRGREVYEEKFMLSRMIGQIETLYDQLLGCEADAGRA